MSIVLGNVNQCF